MTQAQQTTRLVAGPKFKGVEEEEEEKEQMHVLLI